MCQVEADPEVNFPSRRSQMVEPHTYINTKDFSHRWNCIFSRNQYFFTFF